MSSRIVGSGLNRSGWAAVGAAVAVSVGAGGGALIHAAVNSSSAVFHALSPVRVFDTRVGSGGVPSAPVGPDSTLDVVVAGVNGVPTDATAVVLNVTVVDGTAPSFLTVWPTGEPKPLASSLNWTGPAATPNGVTAPIGAGGKISFYNLTGTVHVLADVTGYYTAAQTAATPTFTSVVAQTVGAGPLVGFNPPGSIASVSLRLPDVCPGPDSWSVIVSADGTFRTGGDSGQFPGNATIGLGLSPTSITSGTAVTQNFDSAETWNESYSTSFIFTVDSGSRTFYELGNYSHLSGVSAEQNNLYAHSVAVEC